MRDIIFRGIGIKSREWVYGAYVPAMDEDDCDSIIDEQGEHHIVFSDTVGQYTGMKDKNGKKIFEGDIMSLVTEFGDTIIREIRFIDGAFCVIGEQEDDLHGLSWAVEMCDGIVGDNIHDNPDLLK